MAVVDPITVTINWRRYPFLYHSRLRLANWIERVSASLMCWLRNEEKKDPGVLYVCNDPITAKWMVVDEYHKPLLYAQSFAEAWAMMQYHTMDVGRKARLTGVRS